MFMSHYTRSRGIVTYILHSLDKLGTRHLFSNSAPEPVQVNVAFDISSLILYGCRAIPIRLKLLLLDRLFSVLEYNQVLQVLHGFGWTIEDYRRGYILQGSHSGILDRWSICSPEEEPLVLQQFLRFGETRAITQQLLLAQQTLQNPTLERLERHRSPNLSRAMSPNHRPSHQIVPHSAFHASRLPTMSPHQKHHINFLKMPSSNGLLPTSSPPRSVSASPLNTSPLNRLQNMQLFDFRKLGSGISNFSNRVSPELSRKRNLESETVGLNLTMPTSLPSCLPPPAPPAAPSAPPPRPMSLCHSASEIATAVSVNSLAAASLVASSFPGLMSTKMTTRCKSPSSADVFSGNNNSEEDDDVDENSHSALNLSRDRDILKAPRQPQPIAGRKPATPIKRQWGSPGLPLNLGTQFINPATGKKRVQCNVCLKTFCDKGALKIHFSAVHLREMHKCTVEGCNMMFSSRRSRNRHSANPNPKLHSPHLRRKISPHDGRSAQAHPLLMPPQTSLSLPAAAAALNPLNPFGPFPLLTPPPDIRHHTAISSIDFQQTLDLSFQRLQDKQKSKEMSLGGTHQQSEEDEDEDDDGIVVVGGEEEEDQEKSEIANERLLEQPEDFSMPSKRQKISVSDVDEDITSNLDSNEDSLSIVETQSLKDESNLQTKTRKRKSQNPTRCAAPALLEDAISDGDSSNDVFSNTIAETHDINHTEKLLTNSVSIKKEVKTNKQCESPLNLEKRCSDVNANESEKLLSSVPEIKTSLAPLFMIDKIKKEKPLVESEPLEENEERPVSSVESNKSDESFDSSTALRHLESLSHGHFGDLISKGLHLGLGGPGAQFPPIAFMMGGGPPSPARSQVSSAGSSNGGESPDENSQNHFFGHFDNGQFISGMDVPIDKDNPRKCTACGKIFQNHFGVKTHYQNVHLKLMHKCNVDGCNAAFPSKRSRDRHSANLNLHRKLLSTSSDNSAANAFLDKSPFALHGDFLTRLYAEEALKSQHLPPTNLDQLMLNSDRLPHPPLLLPPLAALPFSLGNFSHFSQFNGSILPKKESTSRSNSPVLGSQHSTNPSPTSLKYIHCVDEDKPTPDKNGNLPCRLCRTCFSSSLQLKEHCETNHLSEMFKCTIMGCNKVFISRTRRNLHSENESLHLNLLTKSSENS